MVGRYVVLIFASLCVLPSSLVTLVQVCEIIEGERCQISPLPVYYGTLKKPSMNS